MYAKSRFDLKIATLSLRTAGHAPGLPHDVDHVGWRRARRHRRTERASDLAPAQQAPALDPPFSSPPARPPIIRYLLPVHTISVARGFDSCLPDSRTPHLRPSLQTLCQYNSCLFSRRPTIIPWSNCRPYGHPHTNTPPLRPQKLTLVFDT